MKADYKKDREALPSELHGTYDDALNYIFRGAVPKRSVRLDMLQACVEAFDYLIKLLARSHYCILFSVDQQPDSDAIHCTRDCERCIRSFVYSHLDHDNNSANAAKEI